MDEHHDKNEKMDELVEQEPERESNKRQQEREEDEDEDIIWLKDELTTEILKELKEEEPIDPKDGAKLALLAYIAKYNMSTGNQLTDLIDVIRCLGGDDPKLKDILEYGRNEVIEYHYCDTCDEIFPTNRDASQCSECKEK